MPTVQGLISLTETHSVSLLASSNDGDVPRRDITRIVILQNLITLQSVPTASLVIVPSGLFSRQDSSGLDVLIRRLAERGVIAVLVQGLVNAQSRLQRLSDRFNVAVLGCPAFVDLGDLVTTLNYSVGGGPADTLLRTSVALDHIRAWSERSEGEPEALVSAVGSIIGEPLLYGVSIESDFPVIVNGLATSYVATADESVQTPESRLVIPALINAIGARIAVETQRRYALTEECSRALSALIIADAASVELYSSLARQLSLDVDGFHVAMAINSRTLDPVLRDLEFRQAQFALETAFADSEIELWPTRVESSLGAILSSRVRGHLNPNAVQSVVQHSINRVGSDSLFWGLGTEHVGPTGIRTSMFEARSASNTAAAEEITKWVVLFDASGIQRLISEVRASVTAGRVAREILAPLQSSSNDRVSIETLNVWLEERGSLKAAAARLHLHPNAVAYRMNKIAGILDVKLSDPDTRFALQLACRVALMP